MQVKQRKINPIKTNLLVDIAIFTAFLVAPDPRMAEDRNASALFSCATACPATSFCKDLTGPILTL
jgi:hypothetical protein